MSDTDSSSSSSELHRNVSAVLTDHEAEAVASHGHGQAGFWGLAIGAIGVVYGDIGTSPLYAMKEALHHTRAGTDPHLATFGVISLVFWAMLLLVTVKYVLFLMRADNKGEGGTLALMALAQRGIGRHSPWIFILGICGAALFYGDSLLTPALSVLSAIEGFKEAPGIGSGIGGFIIPISIVILLGLFLIQSRGTEKVARFFGPVMLLWFLAIAGLGLIYIVQRPDVLLSLSPHYGIQFLMANGLTGFVILGSVFLVLTGAEALYADMGHFGRKPINAGWVFLVLPCLVVNYLGQGALTLLEPTAVANPFWRMVPDILYWPMLLLAAAATLIASQAVITGAFSMTQQAVQLGLMPRIAIKRTSETLEGQIYVPAINTMLLIGVIALIVLFQSSSNLTAAYGIAVTGTMFTSTIMAYVVVRKLWRWSRWQALALLVPIGIIETIFLVSNLTKFFDGAWMPLALAGVLTAVMMTWHTGAQTLASKARRSTVALTDVLDTLRRRQPHRVPGTAIFLTSDPEIAPVALMHNLKHNHVLHKNNIILHVRTRNVPRISEEDRISIEVLNDDFKRLTLNYGFMEAPHVPRALARSRRLGLKFDIMATTFFLGKRNVVPSPKAGMPLWQDLIFIFLMKNATNPTEYFQLPIGRVVEMGTQVTV